jgi:hypothetical protein
MLSMQGNRLVYDNYAHAYGLSPNLFADPSKNMTIIKIGFDQPKLFFKKY